MIAFGSSSAAGPRVASPSRAAADRSAVDIRRMCILPRGRAAGLGWFGRSVGPTSDTPAAGRHFGTTPTLPGRSEVGFSRSGDEFLDDLPAELGELLEPAAVEVRQLRVVEAEQPEDRDVQVADVVD